MIQKLKWTDVQELAITLAHKYPYVNPITIRFTDLYTWICELEEFEDDPKRANEKILEKIQALWIEEKE